MLQGLPPYAIFASAWTLWTQNMKKENTKIKDSNKKIASHNKVCFAAFTWADMEMLVKQNYHYGGSG